MMDEFVVLVFHVDVLESEVLKKQGIFLSESRELENSLILFLFVVVKCCSNIIHNVESLNNPLSNFMSIFRFRICI